MAQETPRRLLISPSQSQSREQGCLRYQSQRAGRQLAGCLIVTFIVGLVIVVAIPLVNHLRAKARKEQCSDNLARLARTIHNFDSNSGQLPRGRDLNLENPASWVIQMFPQLTGEEYEPLASSQQSLYFPMLNCPSHRPAKQNAAFSYLLNGGRINGEFEDFRANGTCDETQPASLQFVDDHDGLEFTTLIAESLSADTFDNTPTELDAAFIWDEDTEQVINALPPVKGWPSSRHGAGANLAFCDQSVRFLSEDIDARVYARMMSSDGPECLPPGSTEQPPVPAWQGGR